MHVTAANTVVPRRSSNAWTFKRRSLQCPTDQTNIGTPAENVYMPQDL
jgi:hypothetical protein